MSSYLSLGGRGDCLEEAVQSSLGCTLFALLQPLGSIPDSVLTGEEEIIKLGHQCMGKAWERG